MAIFLNQEKNDSHVETEEALDFIQVGILFFLVYFGTYYLPSLSLSQQTAFTREMTVAFWGDFGIILLAVLQWRRARFPEVRKLFGGLALYHLIYTIGYAFPRCVSRRSRKSPQALGMTYLVCCPCSTVHFGLRLGGRIRCATRQASIRKNSLS